MVVSARASATAAGPAWLRDFFPGYFALVMGTGIVAVAAHLLRYPALSWALFIIALTAYAVLWVILLARIAVFPRAVIADLASHERGPTFLTIVAANGVLGSQFDVFDTLTGLLPALFWFSLGLWVLLVYGFLSAVTVGITKPDLEHGLNGAWLLLVVATESLAVLPAGTTDRRTGAAGVRRAGLLPAGLDAVCAARRADILPLGLPPDACRGDGRIVVDQHGRSGHRHACRRSADGAAGRQP